MFGLEYFKRLAGGFISLNPAIDRTRKRRDIKIKNEILPYMYPFDRKSKAGKLARRTLKFARIGGKIINTRHPEQFKVA